MRIINTARHDYLFFLSCQQCRSVIFTAAAWGMPEASFQDMFNNHRDWCRCIVCLQHMAPLSHMVMDKARRERVMLLYGRAPKPGQIEIIA